MSAAYPDALVPVIHELTALIRAHRAEALEATPHAIDAIVRDVLRDVGRGTAEQLFADAAQRAVALAKAKAEAEGWTLHVERSPWITFTSTFGFITVVSPYLRPSAATAAVPQGGPFLVDGPPRGVRPVNDALRVRGGGLTLPLQRALADFGLDGSFEHAAAKVKEHYGLELHRTTVRRTVLKHGSAADRQACFESMEARFSSSPKSPLGPPVLVEMDGSCVRTGTLARSEKAIKRTPKRQLPVGTRTTEWKDLRLGFVRPLDEDDATFVGGIVPLDDVANRLRSEAIRLGWTAETVAVRVTDGGRGVREALDRAFPTGVHILDKPHLLHHLHEAADAMGFDKDSAAKEVERWAKRISGGEVDAVIREFAACEGPGQERAVQLAHYLQRFRDAVHYDEFVRLGYPIGSGEIESAHKGQVQIRMKLPGTWWTEANANRLLALRLVRANRRWENHWASAA